MSTQTMASSALSTHDLRIAIANVGLEKCIRVLPWNCIPQFIHNYPIAFILNEDDSYSEGTHWSVVFYPYENGVVEFFDSYGRRPRREFVRDRPHIYSKACLQGLFTSSCGYYCLYFLWLRLKLGYVMSACVNILSDMHENDIVEETKRIFT